MRNTLLLIFGIVLISSQLSAQYKFTWERKNVDSDASFRGICAVNEKVIWVSGSKGTVLRSIDGGESFEKLYVSGGDGLDFRDVQAFDENRAVIMSSGAGSKSKVMKTIDGGETWEVVHSNTHKDGFFNGIAFWDENNGILAGDPIDNHLYIAITEDGGDTWTPMHRSHIPEMEYQEYSFAGSGSHVSVFDDGQAWIGTGGKSARVFYSTDWGQTWKVTNTPMNHGKGSTGIFSVKFKDHSFGIAVGGDYNKTSDASSNVIISKDKGATWSLVPDHMEFRSCVDYVDGFFIAVGSAGSSYSHNNGTSWHPIDVMGFHTLSTGGSKNAIWAAGADGKVAQLHIVNTH